MNPTTLLAKSRSGARPDVTLEAHLRDTAAAGTAIFRADSRLRQRWLGFFKVASDLHETFDTTLAVAALLHDLGKANQEFLDAVLHRGRQQTLRHEHLSGLVLCLPEVREWLMRSPRLDVDVVIAAVLSHHFKVDESGDHKWCQPRGAASLKLLLDHDEVRRVLSQVADVAGLGEPPRLDVRTWGANPPWTVAWDLGRTAARRFREDLRTNHARRALHLAVKAGLIVSDAASSGLVREGHPIETWVADVVHSEDVRPADIEEAILGPRRLAVEARTGRPFSYHRFQELAALQGRRSLLLAACGAGKTLAAWRWLASVAESERIGSAIFLYPTRGTATEGFRDYVAWAPEAEAALVHGTARYELERMLDNPPDAMRGKRGGRSESEERLFALGYWSKRYFSATVDQFFSFLEHGYASTCLLPRLADSAVVIDEVHSFDRRLFDALIAFLANFDVPVLCMTATLGPSRRAELVNVGLQVFPKEEHRSELADLEAAERHPRYRLRMEADVDRAFGVACGHAREGKRVLWVTNTVARCQARSRQFVASGLSQPITYHSRFRLVDRQLRHQETIAAFQSSAAAVAVTTQVCEMSLDLDADVLVTELAPVSSLVQRFGRANRHARPGDSKRADVIVIPAPSSAPYDRDELELAAAFVTELGAGEVSQRTLADGLDRFSAREPTATTNARFVSSGYFAVPGSLREEDDSSGSAVLDDDVAMVIERIRTRKRFDELIVPAPRRLHLARPEGCQLPPFLGTVPSSLYDSNLGLLMDGSA